MGTLSSLCRWALFFTLFIANVSPCIWSRISIQRWKIFFFLLLLLFGTTIKARRFFFFSFFIYSFRTPGLHLFLRHVQNFHSGTYTLHTHTHIRSRYVSGNSFIPAHITSSPLRSRARKTAGRSSSTASKSIKKRTGISKGDASFFSAPAAPGGGGGIC